VLAFNTKIEIFPSNIVAKRFNFEKREFFELDESEAEAARKPVAVKF
jgi:LemA protein